MFEKAKARAAERRAQQVAEDALRAHAAWSGEVASLSGFLEAARGFDGFDPATADSPLIAKKGEKVYLTIESAGLVEPRRLPGQWQGRQQGVSVRVAKGVYWRTGGTRGTYSQGTEQQQMIDKGTVVITNQRVVFLGPKYNREWAFSKLLGIQHDDEVGATYLQVSNRQKVSGIAHGSEAAGEIKFRLDLAIASFDGSRDAMVVELEDGLAELKRQEPELPALPPSTQ